MDAAHQRIVNFKARPQLKNKKTSAVSAKGGLGSKANGAAAPRIHARPSEGDPEQLQEFPPPVPADLDNETVHMTERPEHAILEDDEMDDEHVQEQQEDRKEDVTESNPLHVGHFVGR